MKQSQDTAATEMQLTPEQQQQIREAKARGESRLIVEFNDEQEQDWRKLAEQEQADKAETIAHIQRITAAAEQPGFLGDFRRAILVSRRPIDELAAEIGVTPRVLSDFRAGDAELSPDTLDRLMYVLGLRLMQEIPR